MKSQVPSRSLALKNFGEDFGKVAFQGRTVKLREGKMWVVSWVSGFHELYWGMASSHGLGEWTSLVSE